MLIFFVVKKTNTKKESKESIASDETTFAASFSKAQPDKLIRDKFWPGPVGKELEL